MPIIALPSGAALTGALTGAVIFTHWPSSFCCATISMPSAGRTTTRFCLIRHGETDWNVDKRIQGHLDVPLNANGRTQAEATAAGLTAHRFAAIYSSDLCRALETAAAAARRLELKVQPEAGLRERHYGRLQGLTASEIARHRPDDAPRYQARDAHWTFGNGESLHQLADRIVRTIEALAARHAGAGVLCVAHGGVLDLVYRHATGRPLSAPRDFSVPNCALNWLEVTLADGQSEWRIETWADCRHLKTTLDESE